MPASSLINRQIKQQVDMKPLLSLLFVCLFVCLLAELCKSYSTDFHIFDGNMAHRPQKKQSDFGGNLDLDPGIFMEFLCKFNLHA